ncbi:Fur family transcriptional regulator [Chengkuizengella sediminis]|uniref:Fur family transcriptional regulator n=1 Tax=Chengkuizengella sediminis TaxID=1885917 RepID=UPI001389982C|nr:Fur family transcriptional regulator [Chengkuizengella sediminis]NDI36120.1 transcriptional repressor [Chengkuizengella sediminis]
MTSQLEHALKQLKTSGVRMTPQRHAILTFMLNTDTHPSVDEIFKALGGQFPNMSVATIYNNLKVFLDAGLVRELTFGDGASRFDANVDEHYHAICDDCGKIVDFHSPPLYQIEEIASEKTGFIVKHHRMEVHGTCQQCSEA